MAKEHLNYDQLSLTHDQIRTLTNHKEMRGLLGHLVDNSPARVIAHKGNSSHIKLYFENDGIVTVASSPSDHHAVKNNDLQIRRSLASHNIEYQTMGQTKKNKKKDTPEEPPTE